MRYLAQAQTQPTRWIQVTYQDQQLTSWRLQAVSLLCKDAVDLLEKVDDNRNFDHVQNYKNVIKKWIVRKMNLYNLERLERFEELT